MADRVVIVGLRRGGALLPSSELRQMMGRAGREHHECGIVELVVEEADAGVIDEMLAEGATTVKSSLTDPDMLAMALMPEISRGRVIDEESAESWCARSFAQSLPFSKALELLREVKAVREVKGRLEATEIGSCAAKFYFHPADVYAWHENFSMLFNLGLEDHEVAPAWALGNVPFERVIGDLGDRRALASECQARLPLGVDTMKGSLINVVSWWYLMGGPPVGTIRPACLERRKNFGRYLSALKALNRSAGWQMGDYFDELELRVKKGLLPELVPLCKFAGMTKTRGDYLYNLGARSVNDFAALLPKLNEEIDDDFKETIEKVARQCGMSSD